MEGRRGTPDEFATVPSHLVLFLAALVEPIKSIPVPSLNCLSTSSSVCLFFFFLSLNDCSSQLFSRDNNISLGSKVKLMRSLVIFIFLYACESWTLTVELEKRTQALEARCYRRLLNISYKDHVTNEEVRRKIQAAIGEYGEPLTLVKKRKLRWFGHVSRSSCLAKTILQGTVKGNRRGRQKKRGEDNIKEWTGMEFVSPTRAACCFVVLRPR